MLFDVLVNGKTEDIISFLEDLSKEKTVLEQQKLIPKKHDKDKVKRFLCSNNVYLFDYIAYNQIDTDYIVDRLNDNITKDILELFCIMEKKDQTSFLNNFIQYSYDYYSNDSDFIRATSFLLETIKDVK